MFHIGQKIVCVNNDVDAGTQWWPGEKPNVGATYTVIAVTIDDEDDEVVQLYELKRTHDFYKWYGAFRFRPLEERKTDISIFTTMLSPKKQRVEA